MSDNHDHPPAGLPLAALATLRASAGLLPPEAFDHDTLTRFHFGMLEPADDAAVIERLAGDLRFADRSDEVRRARDEWLRSRPVEEKLELWPVDFWHDLDLECARGESDAGDEADVDAWLAEQRALLPATGSGKTPAFRIQAADRAIEVVPGGDGLTITCVLGVASRLAEFHGHRVHFFLGSAKSSAAAFSTRGPSLSATVRFSPAAVFDIAREAARIRTMRLTD